MAITLKDIAERTGVSIAAVSMALRDHPRIGARRRREIQAIAQAMGYEPDLSATVMRSQRTRTVGMLVSNFRVQATNLRSDLIEQAVAGTGHRVQVAFTQSEPEQTYQQIRLMRASRVEALIIHGQLTAYDTPRLYEELGHCRFPVVLADCFVTPPSLQHVSLGIDRAQGMAMLAEHLIAAGRRDILFVGSELRGTNGVKFQGVLAACQAAGVRLRYADIASERGWVDGDQALHADMPRGMMHRGRHSTRALYAKVKRMAADIARWPDRPDAVMASNDELAMIVVGSLAQHGGLRVPQDIAVTGHDDILPARLFLPALTTVREPRRRMAKRIADVLVDLLEDRPPAFRSQTLIPRVVVRRSCGAGWLARGSEGSPDAIL